MQTHNNVAKKEELEFELSHQATKQPLKCNQCYECGFISFFSLDSHNCVTKEKFKCCGCENKFTSKQSYSAHLIHDHNVRNEEIEFFINDTTPENPQQKIHIVDYQLLKKSDTPELNQQRSKIFIKDVTLLRNPDLPNDTAIPNIFDSLDLTTTDDDLFDDFLGSDDQIFDDDFDFEESANLNHVETFPTPEPVPEVEIVTPVEFPCDQSGKIFVRKNLCVDGDVPEPVAVEPDESTDVPTSKIYVRSHESLMSQVITTDIVSTPSEASTPDCVIVSSETIPPEAPTSKIFIRNIETLTNPLQEASSNQYFSTDGQIDPAQAEGYLNLTSNYTPSIFVRSYDSLVNDSRPEQPKTPQESNQVPLQPLQRCKISIKNMNTLIEPNLMQPPLINPSSMIFGQAQNLVIHMRPQQTDESLLSYRDTSMTPDSSNVSTCGGNEDVILLDDCEITNSIFTAFDGTSEIAELMQTSHVDAPGLAQNEIPQMIENPERIETPNEKTVLEKLEILSGNQDSQNNNNNLEDQPMVRIPLDLTESPKEPDRKRVKIVKIIRIKKKKDNCLQTSDAERHSSLQSNIQVIFKCSQQDCNLHFSSDQLLKYHRKCHSRDGVIACPECKSEEFKTFNTLHTHLWRSHKVDMDLYACKLCDFKTPFLSRLQNFHAKIHSDERNYKCTFAKCGKSFKNSKQLINHTQIHKAKKKVKVKTQAQQTDSISKRIHCGECNKGFSSESGLYIHSMEHKTDEKKFNCEECEYCTNDHNSFRRHKSQHSFVHQYKCPACEYSSIQSNTYRRHLEKQHPELAESLLYKCNMCKYTTISKGKYDGHMAKHIGDGDDNEVRRKQCKKIR